MDGSQQPRAADVTIPRSEVRKNGQMMTVRDNVSLSRTVIYLPNFPNFYFAAKEGQAPNFGFAVSDRSLLTIPRRKKPRGLFLLTS